MAKKFNPFIMVDCSLGAPLGRMCSRDKVPNPREPLYVTPAQGVAGYDKGGAYWGLSTEGLVWAVHNHDGSFCRYVRAWSNHQAFLRAMPYEAVP